MSATVALVSAAVLVKAVLVGALVVQHRRRRREDEVQEEQQRLTHLARVAVVGELSGGLAHELNQPLTSILSNAQAAQQALAQGDKVNVAELREILDDIVAEDKRASALIERLRSLLRREEPTLQGLSLGSLLKDCVCLLRSRLTADQVQVKTAIAADLPDVLGDSIQLQQVVLNLLLNACDALADAAPEDRRIVVAAQREKNGHFVHVSVSDRGPGIDADGLERVFDAFFTTKPNGLGLGLAICRQIVAAHGGRLWATLNEGRGTVFHLTLPVFRG
jgi:C4-dicarboxylate-specific signal transduction histidine kinase